MKFPLLGRKPLQVVWFKRDLRVRDHLPLVRAAEAGPCVLLYVYEPELYEADDFDPCHITFVNQSLKALERELAARGARMTYRVGKLPHVFAQIHEQHPIAAIHAHEETGNAISYERDKRVRAWANEHGIAFHEYPQFGVFRGLKNRDGWAAAWRRRMSEPIIEPPARIRVAGDIAAEELRVPNALGLENSTKLGAQTGGEEVAHSILDDFLESRGVNYRKGMSSPVTAVRDCSRLSPYIAWGNISMKTIYQKTRARKQELKQIREEHPESVDPRFLPSLTSFMGRLRWHCHFMQKLEDEPRIEFENMARFMDGLREDEFDEDLFEAWKEGRTGFPMVDACMRALHHTGWINFRMRAMLVSFSSYHLWLHWRKPALYLATQFVDYEPGIHYSQFQMQSGTTGINTIRMYSPAKQVKDHDPTGKFIRKYVPELANVPDNYLAEPHKMPAGVQRESKCIIGEHYPRPVVDHAERYRDARKAVYARRKSAEAIREKQAIYQRHGSRKRPGQKLPD